MDRKLDSDDAEFIDRRGNEPDLRITVHVRFCNRGHGLECKFSLRWYWRDNTKRPDW